MVFAQYIQFPRKFHSSLLFAHLRAQHLLIFQVAFYEASLQNLTDVSWDLNLTNGLHFKLNCSLSDTDHWIFLYGDIKIIKMELKLQ